VGEPATYPLPGGPAHPQWPAIRAGMRSAHAFRLGGATGPVPDPPGWIADPGWWRAGFVWGLVVPRHLVALVLEATGP